jgi:REP element-mobilizing transposase RayT
MRRMRCNENYCGIRVLSFCITTNHFHTQMQPLPKAQVNATLSAVFRNALGLMPFAL